MTDFNAAVTSRDIYLHHKLWHHFSIFFSSEKCHLFDVFFTSKICCFFSCVCLSVFVSRVVLFLCVLFLLCYFSVFLFLLYVFAQEKCGLYLVCFPLQYICITSHVFYITDKTVEPNALISQNRKTIAV